MLEGGPEPHSLWVVVRKCPYNEIASCVMRSLQMLWLISMWWLVYGNTYCLKIEIIVFSKFWPFSSQSAYEGGFLSSKIWSFTWGCRLWLTSPPKHVDLAKWFTQKLWRWALHTLMLFSWRLMATLITILGWVLLQNCSGSCFCILKLCLPSLFPCGGTINAVPWPRKGSLVCFYAKPYDTENVWIYGLTTLVSKLTI